MSELDRKIRVSIDGRGAKAGSTQVQRALRDITRSGARTVTSIKGLTSQLFSLKAAFAGLGAGLAINTLINARKEYDAATASLKFLAGSAEGGAEAMSFIEETAERLGQKIGVLEKAYVQMAGSVRGTTVTTDEMRTTFVGVVEAMTTFNRPAAATERALVAIGQMFSKGTVNAEEFKGQLGEHLPGAAALGAKAIDALVKDFMKLMQQGKLGNQFVVDFGKTLRTDFVESAEAAAEGVTGQFNRMSNAIELLKRDLATSGILDPVLDAVKALSAVLRDEDVLAVIRSGAEAASKAINGLIDSFSVLAQVAGTFAAMRIAGLFSPLVVGIYSAVAGFSALDVAMVRSFAGMTALGMASTVAARGLTLLGTAARFLGGPVGIVAGIATGIYLYVTSAEKAIDTTSSLTREYELLRKGILRLNEENANIRLDAMTAAADEARVKVQRIQRQIADAMTGASGPGGAMIAPYLPEQLDEASETFNEAAENQMKAQALADAAHRKVQFSLRQNQGGDEETAGKANKAADEIRDMVGEMRDQVAMYGLSDTAAMAYRVTIGDLADSIKSMGTAGATAATDLVTMTAELSLAEERATALADAQDAWAETVEEIQTPLEEHQARLRELANLEMTLLRNRKEMGLTSGQIVETISTATQKQIEDYKKLQDQGEETFNAIEEFSIQAARSMQTAMSDFFVSAMRDDFDGLVDSFRLMVQRMLAELAAKQVMALLIKGIGMLGSAGGPKGDPIASMLYSGRGRVATHAMGGPIGAGEVSLTGERETELFLGKSGAIPLGANGPEMFKAPEAGIIFNQQQLKNRRAGEPVPMSISIVNNGAPAKVDRVRQKPGGELEVVLSSFGDSVVERLVSEMQDGYGTFHDGLMAYTTAERNLR